MLIDDVSVRDVGFLSVFQRPDGVFHIEVIKYPRKQRQRPREIHMDVQQRFHRAVQPVHEGNRRRDGTDGETGVGAGDDEVTARKVDEQRTELGKQSHHHAKPAAALLLLQAQLRDFFIDLHKAFILPLFPGKELDQKRARDRERLVDELVHLVALCLAVGEQFITLLSDSFRRQDQQRDHHDPHQRQLPAHGKQSHQARDHRRGIGDDV